MQTLAIGRPETVVRWHREDDRNPDSLERPRLLDNQAGEPMNGHVESLEEERFTLRGGAVLA